MALGRESMEVSKIMETAAGLSTRNTRLLQVLEEGAKGGGASLELSTPPPLFVLHKAAPLNEVAFAMRL
jgi:hypothetical protein